MNPSTNSAQGIFNSFWKFYILQKLVSFGLVTLVFLTAFSSPNNASAFSCDCLMDQKVSSGTFNNLGHHEFCSPSSPPKYYLTYTSTKTFSWLSTECGESDFSVNYTHKIVQNTDFSTLFFNGYSGYWSVYTSQTESGGGSYPCFQDGVASTVSWTYQTNGTIVSTNDPCNQAGDYADQGYFEAEQYFPNTSTNLCSPTERDWYSAENSAAECSTPNASSTINASSTTKEVYSQEFTTSMLKSFLLANMTNYPNYDYPTNWSTGTSASSGLSLDDNAFWMQGSKLKYRLHVPAPTEAKASYLCKWQEVKTTIAVVGGATTTNVDITLNTETIMGTGDLTNAAYGSEHEVQMPPGIPTPGGSITIQELNPSVEKVIEPGTPGSGGQN